MTPANRIRLTRLRLRWCRVRSCYARARLQTVTRYYSLRADLRQSPAHRRLLILGLLGLVASVSNWMLALYVLPSLVALVRQRPGVRFAFVINLLLGWTVVGWLWVMFWAMLPNAALSRPVQVRTRVRWQITPKANARTIRV